MVKNLPAIAGDVKDVGSVLGLGRSPGAPSKQQSEQGSEPCQLGSKTTLSTPVLNQSSLPRHRAQHRCRQRLYLNSGFRKVFCVEVFRRKILRVRKWGWGGKEGGLSTLGTLEKRRMGRKRMLRKGGSTKRQRPEVTAGLGCSQCSSGPRPQLPPRCG